uniref:Uncharacterized protein n=1 Tax=Bracon brevicornis TaxID=1563983 RepID=A0A6V7L5U9_9HYME
MQTNGFMNVAKSSYDHARLRINHLMSTLADIEGIN